MLVASVIASGDALRTTCTYNTNKAAKFGFGSSEEMYTCQLKNVALRLFSSNKLYKEDVATLTSMN